MDACADRRAGGPGDDRLYQYVAAGAAGAGDAVCWWTSSASTDGWVVAGDLRVVDVEKEALLVVCEALDALGDPYADPGLLRGGAAPGGRGAPSRASTSA